MDLSHRILVVEDETRRLFEEIAPVAAGLSVKHVLFRDAANEIKNSKPHLVIVHIPAGDKQARVFAGENRETLAGTYSAVSAGEISPGEIVDFMRGGFCDFLPQPVRAPEFQTLLSRMSEWHNRRGTVEKEHLLASFFSPKGGVGVTLACVNAAVSLAARKVGSVAVADFDLQHGNVAEFLDLAPQYTLLNLLENRSRLDSRLLDHSIQKHRSGLAVLPHPAQAEESECFFQQETEEVVGILKKSFDFTLLDLGHELNACSLACLDASDFIFVVSTPDFPSLFNARRALALLKKMGVPDGRIKLILNRWRMKGQIDEGILQKHLTHPVLQRLAEDCGLALSAVNHGLPVEEISSRAELTRGLRAIADFLARSREGTAQSEKKRGAG